MPPMDNRLLRPRASASSFDPRTIAGLNLWIDFSDSSVITLDANGLIQQVNDKSTAATNVSQGTGANRPAVGNINGVPAGDWGTATNDKRLFHTTAANYQESAIVAVWDANTTTFNPNFAGLITGSVGGILIIGGGDANWFTASGALYSTNLLTNGVTTTLAFPAIKSPSVVQGFSTTALAGTGVSIGQDRNIAGRGWLGRIGEVLCFNRELTAAERLRVRRGLAAKWKVSL
jgi:hypothetical protein